MKNTKKFAHKITFDSAIIGIVKDTDKRMATFRGEQPSNEVVAFLIGGGWAMSEYITCSRCGVVKRGHQCPHRPYRKKDRDTQADKFRKTKAWTNKSIEIRQRDRYLCRVCMANRYNTIRQYNYNKLEVHHITPINEDYNKRLDNDNLITLCVYHHKLADNGEIPREELKNLISPPAI